MTTLYLLKWHYCSSGGYDHGEGELGIYSSQCAAELAGDRYLDKIDIDDYDSNWYEVVPMKLKGKL